MKTTICFLLATVILLINSACTLAFAAGQKDIGEWNVRWGDAGEYGAYARIEKTYWLDDIREGTEVSASIQQDIVNLVSIAMFYKRRDISTGCRSSEENSESIATINGQPIKMKMTAYEYTNCERSFTWNPISSAGKAYLRKAFNSGVVRFSHGSVDHIFDTRNNLPAYKLMKNMVAEENRKAKNAL